VMRNHLRDPALAVTIFVTSCMNVRSSCREVVCVYASLPGREFYKRAIYIAKSYKSDHHPVSHITSCIY